MSATTWPGLISSARMARLGASSDSRSGRSSQPAPATPITGAITRPLTGWRRLRVERRDQQREAEGEDRGPARDEAACGTHRHHVCQLSSLRRTQDGHDAAC